MGGWGFILPFTNLFYVSLGFSGKQIGIISSASAIVGMVASPVWVSTVKRHPLAQRILQAAIVLGALGYYLIGRQTHYLAVIFIVCLHALASSGVMPLSDSMAVTVSRESGKGYGSVRAWASLGWIICLLSSGQQVYARGSDLVVLAMVSFGAEVIADGNIHVYAPLRGRAIAGARGDTSARIFSTCLEPQLVSVAGIYRTTETELPADVRGNPAQVRLDGEKLLIEPL